MVVGDENSDLCLSHKNKVFWFEKALTYSLKELKKRVFGKDFFKKRVSLIIWIYAIWINKNKHKHNHA